MNTMITISVAQYTFKAELKEDLAPKTCEAFLKLIPFKQKIIQARWSGESAWIPLGEMKLNVPLENQTAYPKTGEILFYPGGISETEILFPYGKTHFACKHGELSGNFFLKIIEGLESLAELGEMILWQGAQDVTFESSAIIKC